MLVQINTDRNVEGREELSRRLEDKVRAALDRYSGELTRVEVHLGDENSSKKGGGADMRCTLEARPAGLRPIAVRHNAATMEQAIDGALERFQRAIGRAKGKLRDR